MRFSTAGALVLSWSAAAHADPLERGALRLDWSAPGGCPNGVEVFERIEALLGTRVVELHAEAIAARGNVTQVEPLRFELALETRQSEQRFERSMQAPSCAELSDAGALVLALALDPTLAERQAKAVETMPPVVSSVQTDPPALEPPRPAPAPSKSVTTLETTVRDEGAPPEAPAPSSTPVWAARAGVLFDLGTVSQNSFGFRGAAAARFGAFRARAGLSWLPPARSLTAENPERGGDIDLVAGDLAGCFVPLRGELEVEGCGGFEIGRLHGEGYGTVTISEDSAVWLGAELSAVGRYRATDSLGVFLGAGVVIPPQATEFTLENVGVVHRTPPAVGRFGLGIETEFE